MPAPFLDSNIHISAVSDVPRSETARELVRQHFVISVESLNEFANVARRKLRMPWSQIGENSALYLASRYEYSCSDACILAAAIRSRASVLDSKDMHSGQKLEEGVWIVNPFEALRQNPG